MKKILAIVAIAGVMVACNNGGSSKSVTADSTKIMDSVKNMMNNLTDSANKMMNKMTDSASKMMNNAMDTVKSKMKM